jgi:hypothetical protein
MAWEDEMNLMDVYVAEVGRHLPAKNRADIEKEIRSMIEDTLEDRAAGQEPSEELVVDVLKKLGPPDKVAASYLPPRYLIGPELFPAFLTSMRIVLAVVIFFSLIGFGVTIGKSAGSLDGFIEGLAEAISGVFGSMFTSLGVVVLIFALIQWFVPQVKTSSTPWDPRKMKLAPEGEQVKVVDQVLGIVFTTLAIVIFNFFPQYVGFGFTSGERWTISLVPGLTDAFFKLLPWFNVVWGLEIVLYLVLLRLGRWVPAVRWADVALKVLSLGVAYAVISAPPLFAVTAQGLADAGWPVGAAEAFAGAQDILYNMFRIGVGIGMAAGVFDLGKKLYNLLLKDRMSFASIQK